MNVGVNTLFLLPGRVGGSETVTRNLLRAMRRLAPNFTLTLFTNSENHSTFAEYGRIKLRVPARFRVVRTLSEQLLLPRVARRVGVDVLLSLGYTAPLRTAFPQVVMMYDTSFLAYPEDFGWISRVIQRGLIPRVARAVDRILTGSEFARREIARGLGIEENKVHIVPFGVDSAFKPVETRFLADPYVLCVANAYPHKNLNRLVNVFTRLADNIPHRLVLVGQPGMGEPAPHPRVIRFSHVPQARLIQLYSGCDVFILPSLYEGFGLPVLEAMACGARVVVSRAASLPEVAGEAASYFHPEDEHDMAEVLLAALQESPETRNRYRVAGVDRAAKFTWEKTAAAVMDILHAVQ